MEEKRSVDFYLVGILAFSVCVNLGLVWRVHTLTPVLPQRRKVGSKVKALDALDMTGKATHVSLTSGNKSIVIYAFTPTCGWCAKNLNNIKEIYRLEHPDFDFIGVSLSGDGIPEYVLQSGFPLKVVKAPSAASKEIFHFDATPETIVIDSKGMVKEVWIGAYGSETCRDMEQFFRLPQGTLTAIPSHA